MKRNLINLGAVMMALFIGLAINNACAEKDNPDEEQETVVVSFFHPVDGLLFGSDGKVANMLDSFEGSFTAQALMDYFALEYYIGDQKYSCSYDKEGRLAGMDWKLTYISSIGEQHTLTMKVVYTYDGLIVKESLTFDNEVEVIKKTNTYTYLPIDSM